MRSYVITYHNYAPNMDPDVMSILMLPFTAGSAGRRGALSFKNGGGIVEAVGAFEFDPIKRKRCNNPLD